MKVGDIVKAVTNGSQDPPRRIVAVDDSAGFTLFDVGDGLGFDHVPGELQPLTVSDLFREAGFPWPEGKPMNIASFDGTSILGYVEEANKYHTAEWFWSMSINHSEDGWDYVSIWDFDVAPIDLSRLPADDAWDCLPEAVKAVVQESGT